MNKDVRNIVNKIAANNEEYVTEYTIQRPFTMVKITHIPSNLTGQGFACCQLPDLWDSGQGLRQSFIRAVKNLLGMPTRVEKSEYLATQVVGYGS